MVPRNWLRLPTLAFALCFFAAPVHAEPIRANNYYEDTAITCPSDSLVCRLDFSKLGPKNAVLFKRVSCYFGHRAPIRYVRFGSGPADAAIERYVTLEHSSTLSGQIYFTSINQEVLFLAAGRDVPGVQVVIESSGFVSGRCTITGAPAGG